MKTKLTAILIRMPPELKKKFDKAVKKTDLSVNQQIVMLIKKHLESLKDEKTQA